jgi:6-phosphogluconolactonase (cycloisomerase 2 family)
MSPDGKYLYAGGSADTSIMEFAVQDGGKLVKVGSVPAPKAAADIKVDPKGRYVYVEGVDGNGATFSSYAMAGNGALAPTGSSVMVPGAQSARAGLQTKNFAVSSDGKFLFTANGDNAAVSVIGVGDDGSLEILSTTKVDAPTGIIQVEYSDGFVYLDSPCSSFTEVGCGDSKGIVFAYRVGPDGALTQTSRAVLNTEGDYLAVGPRGRFVYVFGSGGDSNSKTHEITPLSVSGDGKLTVLASTKLEEDAVPLLVGPQAKRLYAAAGLAVKIFSIKDDGSLAAMGSVKLSGGPLDMVLDPEGRMLYTANFSQRTISAVEVSE